MLTLKETATKALVAAVGAFATGIGTQLSDGQLTTNELGISVGAALLAGVATFYIPNKPLAKADAADDDADVYDGLDAP